MNATANTIDLVLTADGDLNLRERDIMTSIDDPLYNIRRHLYDRLVLSDVDWGNSVTEELKNGLLTLSSSAAQAFYKPVASLKDFHGSTLDNAALESIKTAVESAIYLDDVFNGIDVRVTVGRYTESSVSVSVIARVTMDWFLSGFGRDDFGDSQIVRGKIKDSVIIVTMHYDTASGVFSVSNIDYKEYA